MKRILGVIMLLVVTLVTLSTIVTPATSNVGVKPVEPYTIQTVGLHGLSVPPGVSEDTKIKAVVVVKGSVPYSKVLQLYNNLKKITITMLGKKFSIVASRLRKDPKGYYVFKVIGPIGKIVSALKPYKAMVLGLQEKPLINFETALLTWPKSKNYLITDSAKEPDLSKIKPGTNNFFIRYLIGAAAVNSYYGINGSGIKVAVVDTGVDYGNPDLQGALEYYVGKYNGETIREPLVLDADENLIILFKSFTANSTGYINVGKGYFEVYTPWEEDIKAPYTSYYVGNITSASGTYKFGVLYEYMGELGKWVKVGVLLTDPTTAGNYTTLYIDANNNSIFNDPEDIKVTYDGNRILAAYKPGSTWPYASFGVAGGFFLDTYWWFDWSSLIYPGWDLEGRYLSIFYDFYGHGTACASAIASRGFPEGIAPGAKIIGVKGLWFGDVEVGMLWAAGFDIDSYNYSIIYTGAPRADIISNSWGISNFIYDIAGFGYDFESLFVNALSTPGFLNPNYPGVLVVQAAGNGGAGYGTVTTPGAAAGVLTVGASTSTHLEYLLYGFGGIAYDDIVSWAARGPAPAGYVKPDVVNVGAWGLTAAPVWLNGGNYTIFGGTSYATPLTAGVAALVYQALRIEGMNTAPPWFVKQIIMNTAKNLHYPPFDEGAGRVDALAAVQLALQLANPQINAYEGLRIYSYSFYKYTGQKISRMWEWMWLDYCYSYLYYWYWIYLPQVQPTTSLNTYEEGKAYSVYVPDIPRGGIKYFQFNIENPTTYPAMAKVSVVKPVKIKGPMMYYLRFNLRSDQEWTYKYIVISPSQIPKDTDYLTVDAVLPYNVFDGDNDYYADYAVGVIAYVWIGDFNHNGVPDVNERVVVNFGYSLSNHNLVQVKLPLQLLAKYGPNAKLLIRVYIERGDDITPAKLTLRNQIVRVAVTYYGFQQDNWVKIFTRLPGGRVYIKAKSTEILKGIIRIPTYAAPTAYQDYIKVETTFANGKQVTYYVPLSYTVYTVIRSGWSMKINTGAGANLVPYSWSLLKGDNAWDWRYESGDWRAFYVKVVDPKVWLLQVQARWSNPYTNLVTYTLGPDGQFAGVFYGGGASFHYYLGSGRFLWVDTGRYKVANTFSSVSFPTTAYRYGQYPPLKPNLGIYTILVRTVLFGGYSTEEGFGLYIRAIPNYRMLPSTVMPTKGKITTYVMLPYKASSISFQFVQPEMPEYSTQGLCGYMTLWVNPEQYSHPSTVYRYTIGWGDLSCWVPFSKPRIDLAILYYASIPYLTVYYKYRGSYEVWTQNYVFEDWMITGSSQFSWYYP